MSNLRPALKEQFFKAVFDDDIETVRASLNAGIHIDEKYGDHSTAIMLAIFDGQKEMVEELLKYNPDLHIEDDVGLTPAFMAQFCTMGMGRTTVAQDIKNQICHMVELKVQANKKTQRELLKQKANQKSWQHNKKKKLSLKRRR